MWIDEKDGWRDESTEGPYIETLKTKGDFSIFRGLSHQRTNDMFVLRKGNEKLGEFKTVDEAKEFAEKNNDLSTLS